MHPVESIDQAAETIPGTEDELTIAGEGAPLVAEFCVADLGLALGVSTDSARRLLGDALELRYRLPRLWGRVLAGTVPVWKARRVAAATIALGRDAARHADRHLAPVIERCSYAQIDRTVEAAKAAKAAKAMFDPDAAQVQHDEVADHRYFMIDTQSSLTQGLATGIASVHGVLDLADTLALDAAVAAKAHDLLDTTPSSRWTCAGRWRRGHWVGRTPGRWCSTPTSTTWASRRWRTPAPESPSGRSRSGARPRARG
jgi:hypothetical protein